MMAPKVTVLMPVYNGERYLAEAIESILNQTFGDFEFLIINDGSQDNSRTVLNSYSDARIRVIDNERNFGLSATLNKGMELALGEYIARMDCDDICLPTRLERQVNLMDSQPEVGVCGTWFDVLGQNAVRNFPQDDARIRIAMLGYCALAHPTVMMRKSYFTINGLFYDPAFKYAQDYDLWTRCMDFFALANVGEVLLHYRHHETQMTETYGQAVDSEPVVIQKRQFARLGVEPTAKELLIHNLLFSFVPVLNLDKSETEKSVEWLMKLCKHNNECKYYVTEVFNNGLAELEKSLLENYREKRFVNVKKINLSLVKEFYLSPLKHYKTVGKPKQLGFIIKRLIRNFNG